MPPLYRLKAMFWEACSYCQPWSSYSWLSTSLTWSSRSLFPPFCSFSPAASLAIRSTKVLKTPRIKFSSIYSAFHKWKFKDLEAKRLFFSFNSSQFLKFSSKLTYCSEWSNLKFRAKLNRLEFRKWMWCSQSYVLSSMSSSSSSAYLSKPKLRKRLSLST